MLMMKEETRISLFNKQLSFNDKTAKIWDTRSPVASWVLLLQYVQFHSETNKDYHGTRPSRKKRQSFKGNIIKIRSSPSA